ncbi:hypothetical protein HNO88_001526 [Novosphingobium chloroacetimidivorans]|uniref:Uncharacterized protein n=1 Tax=Novosphingobium chloroacetimidivorans TaxID=1428314 RepID=A0A7W7K8I4_9SPHN|nr:hypothetical protein [Novosphingobium chloroacetimidivorans]MBB4858207.1 hypothetical protein [Novosphingobium chloroacetimidivorans]
MRKLTKIVVPALIAVMGAGTMAVPAQAQAYGRHDAGHATPVRNSNIRADINGLNRDIDRAFARRTISNREATSLKRDAIQVQRLYQQYARNGLTRTETRTLQARVDRIHVALRAERRDRDNRRG